MIQFYFLSITLNLLAGYALSYDRESEAPSGRELRELFDGETFRLVLGVLSFAVGMFKLLSVVRGDVPVVGDLIPSFAGLLSGFALILEFYRRKTTLPLRLSEKLDLVFVKNRKWLGLGAIFAAVAHFLFPTVLFL